MATDRAPIPTKIPALDGVRGIAISLVLAMHLYQAGAIPARYRAINFPMSLGWCGVDLFFVLSGFLITLGLLESKGAVNYFGAFYMRRVLRIFPLYYLVVFVALAASVAFAGYKPTVELLAGQPDGSIFPTWGGWIAHLLYVQNWWMPIREPSSRNVLGHFWSLAVEEQFYLVWPLCVWLLPRRSLLAVSVSICVAVLGLRLLLASHGVPYGLIDRNTVTRADTLIVGALGALVVTDTALLARVRRWLPALAVACVAAIAGIGVLVRSPNAQIFSTVTYGFTAFALLFGTVVVSAFVKSGTRTWSDRLLSLPPLRALGKYSYGIYVYHLPIVYAAKATFGGDGWFGRDLVSGIAFDGGVAIVSVAVAVASYEGFERRFLALKRYFKPAYARAPGREPNASPGSVAVVEVV